MLIIVALILLFVLPHPWNIIGAAICAVAWLGELYLWNRTVRGRKRVVGAQTLVGMIGEVREACRPRGQVFVNGELWEASCEDGADPGTAVRVLAVKGLTLEVRPEPTAR
jgi:membrane protein implicated in regulation of membrane protease activity